LKKLQPQDLSGKYTRYTIPKRSTQKRGVFAGFAYTKFSRLIDAKSCKTTTYLFILDWFGTKRSQVRILSPRLDLRQKAGTQKTQMVHKKVPKLCHHKAKGLAYVRDPRTGTRHYFGRANTIQSVERYNAWVRRYAQDVGVSAAAVARPAQVAGLMALFYADCQRVYRTVDGVETETLGVVRSVMREHMAELAVRPLHEVGKADLVAIRQTLILRGLARKTIREYMRIVLQMFKWGAGLDLMDEAQYLRMRTLPALRQGETRPSKKVQPIPRKHLFMILRQLKEPWKTVLAWQLLTGQRTETALRVQTDEIDQSIKPWRYTPRVHKNTWRGHALTILVGPRARKLLAPLLLKSGYLFPARKMNVRVNCQAMSKPRDSDAYRLAFTRATKRLGLPPYNPQQVRHTSATFLVGRMVPESIIGAILGHHGRGDDDSISTGSTSITGRYAAVPRRRVEAVVEKWG